MPTPKRLPPLPRVTDILKLYGLRAKKQLSQNFLLDLNVTDKIVRCGDNLSGGLVCEVGPGPGALTRSILNTGVEQVLVVEKDKRFLPSLELLSDATDNKLIIHHGDVLDFDVEASCRDHVKPSPWEQDPPLFSIIGNLPFNISIPLLLRWLACIPKRSGPFAFGRTQMLLTFQKEVAERLTAPIGHHQRSRLSIMSQCWCDVKWCFTISGKSFVPAPKVDVAVVKFTPLVQPIINVHYNTLETVVKAVFQYRRKMMIKGIRLLFPDNPRLADVMLQSSGVDPSLRAQQLQLEHIERLCMAYEEVTTQHPHTTSSSCHQ
ncbi:dimethyladenosine transferase 1, mitochondrial-like [Dysidea avara]|uniref:dimethyladenosine transferase 1, mitochondrial-like n=1 Tax=Dysidea avara TaxID=196820 RepID=UPI00331BF3E9